MSYRLIQLADYLEMEEVYKAYKGLEVFYQPKIVDGKVIIKSYKEI